MKQNNLNKKLKGAMGFDVYYGELYKNRWETLKSALLLKPDYAEYNVNGKESYFLDTGSVRAALSLPLKGAKNILDMCAAPGGKTIVLASCMDADATLISNERSSERKNRLAHSVENCLPEYIKNRVITICKDGAKLCLSESNRFDRILLDAPCSSERHVLTDEKYLKEWSPSRIKTIAISQWALLSSAYRMLNPDGYLVYSTCALDPIENDMVVSKLIKKFDDVEILDPVISSDCSEFTKAVLPEGEKNLYGYHILPDVQNGAGPLYFSLIHKKNNLLYKS